MDYFRQLGEIAQRNNVIENQYYHRYKVKNGLRNADGSGVLVGLTTVSSVKGYIKVDEELVPVDGQLFYRGFDIADLVKGVEERNDFGFEEVVYLLLFGQLPTKEHLEAFRKEMGLLRQVPMNFARDVLQTFRVNHIMIALARSILVLYGQDETPEDMSIPNQIRQAMNLIAKINTLIPFAYYSIRHAYHNESLILHTPDPAHSAAENFLHLLRPDSQFSDLEAKTLDIAMMLHADHGGGNNSTFTARVVSSTHTDFYSAMAAAVGSLKGPLHGGANERIMGMMDDIKKKVKDPSNEEELRKYLFRILEGKEHDGAGKIYGVGHAVYTMSDPRATVLKRYARDLAKEKGREEEFALYETIERIGPEVLREYRNDPNMIVSSNVDFYSGFVYESMGIPRQVFTPIFAMARIAGWAAHRIEMLTNKNKIMRPAYKSLGGHCTYTPLEKRGEAVCCEPNFDQA